MATCGSAITAFRPVMEELNRRKAVVTVHPTAADCCRNLDYAPGVGPGSIEYGTDTTRAIIGRRLQRRRGALSRHPLHLVARRRHRAVSRRPHRRRVEQRARRVAQRLHRRDRSGSITTRRRRESRRARVAPCSWSRASQIVFGTDFPPGGTSAGVAQSLDETAHVQRRRAARDRPRQCRASDAAVQLRIRN